MMTMDELDDDPLLNLLREESPLGFPEPGVCQVCGCTELDPCPGGCVWANPQATLCSRCARGDSPCR